MQKCLITFDQMSRQTQSLQSTPTTTKKGTEFSNSSERENKKPMRMCDPNFHSF